MKNIILSVLFLMIFIFQGFSLDYKIHYLKEGETLWRISKIYNIPLNDLCKINNISDVTRIRKGTGIKIPVKNTTAKTAPAKQKKIYYNYDIPMEGNVKPYVTSHFRGIIIFSEKDPVSIRSVDSGEVSFTGEVSGYGMMVIIKHDDNTISTYSGFSKISVKKGDKLKKNQVIGTAGHLSRYQKNGVLVSVQYKNSGLRFDMEKMKFYRL